MDFASGFSSCLLVVVVALIVVDVFGSVFSMILSLSDALEQSLDPAMTEWEKSRESEEFVRASVLYRPSSSFLDSRFTRAKQQEDEDTVEVDRDQEVGTNNTH